MNVLNILWWIDVVVQLYTTISSTDEFSYPRREDPEIPPPRSHELFVVQLKHACNSVKQFLECWNANLKTIMANNEGQQDIQNYQDPKTLDTATELSIVKAIRRKNQ